ncbi:hypothetical protein EX895_006431 [Sporisorium graminicola]|uniref:Uncharacterized protein n=1 Tax=Sporisorium graminicola TaxID=280036 RepID=A0A4V6ET00_9BASI|nr:hypothetical protein EX895_006431 [Sporisorium graminicola]TKY84529.1 hypothetical protein EX895_006431 [Sporisorium graminicola]
MLAQDASASSSSSFSIALQLAPYQSAVFQKATTRMQVLSTPPDLAPSPVGKKLNLPATAAASCPKPSRRQSSSSPSPPSTESGSSADPASATNTPITLASDSSASSISSRTAAFHRQATVCPAFSLQTQPPVRIRPTLANKRVLSEGEVILPRPAKRSRMPYNPILRKRSCNALQSPSSFVPSVPAIASWRAACEQRRRRQVAKSKSKRQPVSLKRATASALRNASCSASSKSARSTDTESDRIIRSYALPELRLLSATRTAPIGWSNFAGAKAFAPRMIEVYDERAAKRAPERERFWPIVDRQLDYTGARMLSHSNSSHRSLIFSNSCTHSGANKPSFDPPVSPKSGLPVCTQAVASSDEDRSPLTPHEPAQRLAPELPRCRASQYALDAVENESRRKSTMPLSPAVTLSAVIDFTRALASQKEQQQRDAAQLARNAYGQPVYSPPSSPQATSVAVTVKGSEPDLAAHTPLRIAPIALAPTGTASDSHRGSDYFGHWETYLCNVGKESTF